MERIEGNIVDIHRRRIFPGALVMDDGYIRSIEETAGPYDTYIAPGFVDAHVHIESSMLLPAEFGRMVAARGTVAVITDPHEIANVAGVAGVEFMLQRAAEAPIGIYFTVPSCVPATPFDCSGGHIPVTDVESLLDSGRFVALSEVMDVPAVLGGDREMQRKLSAALRRGLPIDGHAPCLAGLDLRRYVAAGISTDHECTSLEEAVEKAEAGMYILIRQGSAAQNYEALREMLTRYPDRVMFCTDDAHPDDILAHGHIDRLVCRAVADGYDLFDVLRAASLHPVCHYGLDTGLLRVGDRADFCLFPDLHTFRPQAVYVGGNRVYPLSGKQPARPGIGAFGPFCCGGITAESLRRPCRKGALSCIGIRPNEILTQHLSFPIAEDLPNMESDLQRDILKLVYLNRYTPGSTPRVAYLHGLGLRRGALASSVAHDSHNIIAAGCSDREIARAIGEVAAHRGGLALVLGEEVHSLPLPIGGLMSEASAEETAAKWSLLNALLKENGCRLHAPFMTLSFMSLLVLPELKIGERGLFDYSRFNFLE